MLTDWMDLASCKNIDNPEKFFDLYLESEEAVAEVQDLCIVCPVRIHCLNYGIYMKAVGVWGGRWLSGGKVIKKMNVASSSYFWKD